MILHFYTPQGEVEVNTATVTDAEWLALNLTLDRLAEYRHSDNLADEYNDKSHQGLELFNNWSNLSPGQKDGVLKHLLGYLLWKEGLL